MLPSAILIPAFNSAHQIGNAVGGRIEIMAVDDASTKGTVTVLGSLAARGRAWLMQIEGPGSPLHGALMRHIRSVALALGWLRFAQAIRRLDLVAAFFQLFERPARFRHIGREGLRAVPRTLIQGKRRKHA